MSFFRHVVLFKDIFKSFGYTFSPPYLHFIVSRGGLFPLRDFLSVWKRTKLIYFCQVMHSLLQRRASGQC